MPDAAAPAAATVAQTAASGTASLAVAPAAVAGAGLSAAPTQFLQVEGMVTPDVLADDEEYAEVCCPTPAYFHRAQPTALRIPHRIIIAAIPTSSLLRSLPGMNHHA